MKAPSAVLLPLLAISAFVIAARAQVGAWSTYTDMSDVRSLVIQDGTLWAATGGGVFRYDTRSERFTTYTNIDGLASIDVRAVAIDREGTVFVGLSNGTVNIHYAGKGWSTVPDIARVVDKPQKGINVLRVHQGFLYVGTDFGLCVYDPATRSFRDTYLKFGDLPAQACVRDVFFTGDSIWVATDEGLAISVTSAPNLQDPQSWRSFTVADGLPHKAVLHITRFNGVMVACTASGAVFREDGRWSAAFPFLGEVAIRASAVVEDVLFFATDKRLYRAVSLQDAEPVGPSLDEPSYRGAVIRALAASSDAFFAGTNRGVVDTHTDPWRFRRPEGPVSNIFRSLTIDANGRLWCATGTTADSRGANCFDGARWRNYSVETSELPTDEVACSAAGPDGDVFLGTWGMGVVRILPNDSIELYNPQTVPGFPGIVNDSLFAVVSGLSVDPQGNLWTLHYRGTNGIVLGRRSRDGKWRFYRNPFWDDTYLFGTAIDQMGNKWTWLDYSYTGVMTFNENGTPDDLSDDAWKKIDPSTFLAGSVKAVATDRFGDVWIGTNLGPRTVFNPAAPDKVSRTCYNTRCNVEGQNITCIAVDPVNNKWLGTTSGVFVLSSDGSSILAQYTRANSPLIDDVVTSIVIHPQTGVAYIGTSRGLSSVVTPFVQPSQTAELRISPNPFRPGIDDRIMVEGLPEGAVLKILTISGDLVAEIETPGGGVGFWDGRTRNGDPVASGVYIVVAYQMEGTGVRLGKVAIVRP
ncbi:MAG: hypothetical protein QHI48_02645 [Bacteroidota bacterium]|nr:hypothetical protein [Bacteroidota bacterium]